MPTSAFAARQHSVDAGDADIQLRRDSLAGQLPAATWREAAPLPVVPR
jgi:hypothetical protein